MRCSAARADPDVQQIQAAGCASADVVTCAVLTVSVVSSTDYASAAAAAAAAAVNTDANTALLLVENQKLTASTAPCITTAVS